MTLNTPGTILYPYSLHYTPGTTLYPHSLHYTPGTHNIIPQVQLYIPTQFIIPQVQLYIPTQFIISQVQLYIPTHYILPSIIFFIRDIDLVIFLTEVPRFLTLSRLDYFCLKWNILPPLKFMLLVQTIRPLILMVGVQMGLKKKIKKYLCVLLTNIYIWLCVYVMHVITSIFQWLFK